MTWTYDKRGKFDLEEINFPEPARIPFPVETF